MFWMETIQRYPYNTLEHVYNKKKTRGNISCQKLCNDRVEATLHHNASLADLLHLGSNRVITAFNIIMTGTFGSLNP